MVKRVCSIKIDYATLRKLILLYTVFTINVPQTSIQSDRHKQSGISRVGDVCTQFTVECVFKSPLNGIENHK